MSYHVTQARDVQHGRTITFSFNNLSLIKGKLPRKFDFSLPEYRALPMQGSSIQQIEFPLRSRPAALYDMFQRSLFSNTACFPAHPFYFIHFIHIFPPSFNISLLSFRPLVGMAASFRDLGGMTHWLAWVSAR
jgi:hypothetical protein